MGPERIESHTLAPLTFLQCFPWSKTTRKPGDTGPWGRPSAEQGRGSAGSGSEIRQAVDQLRVQGQWEHGRKAERSRA